MSLLDAFVLEPFSVNESLLDSFLLEPDAIEVWITLRADGYAGSGTEDDPYDASTQSRLDCLLGSFPPRTTIHLGAGTFQTQGFASGIAGGWQPKSGQRIVGAGMEDTVLQVVNAQSDVLTCAIGAPAANFLNGFEVSDLAVDCNMAGQTSAGAACGAVSVSGAHILIQRVRAYNFGTKSPSVKGSLIAVGNVDPSTPPVFDCVIEDCIVEQPWPNNVRETTCLQIGAREDANGVMAYHRGCVIHNCFVDCNYPGNIVRIQDITFPGTPATVTTQAAHKLNNLDYVVISGALENGAVSQNYNGTFQVSSVTATTFQINLPGTPAYQPSGDIVLARLPVTDMSIVTMGAFPNQRVGIKALNVSGNPVTLDTWAPHNGIPGSHNVLVNNVSGMTPTIDNAWAINDLGSTAAPTKLRFSYSGSGTPDYSSGYIGADFRAIEADGGIGTIIENNRIFNCTFGCYHDSYSTKDFVIRNNYFRGVSTAIYQKMGAVSGGGNHTGTSLTRARALAIFNTAQPHTLSVGQIVTISGANQGSYNGVFQIASIPSPTSFTYAMASDPGTDATGSPVCNVTLPAVSLVRSKTLATFTSTQPHGLSFGQAVVVSGASQSAYNGTFPVASISSPTSFTYQMTSTPSFPATGPFAFAALWQVGRLIVENNVIELLLNAIPSGWEAPVGIYLYDGVGSHGSQFIFQQAIIRGNVVRHVDNASDASQIPLGVCLDSCLNAICENNEINLDTARPIRYYAIGSMKFFNNQTPKGLLISGAYYTRSGSYLTVPIYVNDTFNQFMNELTTDADLALSLSI